MRGDDGQRLAARRDQPTDEATSRERQSSSDVDASAHRGCEERPFAFAQGDASRRFAVGGEGQRVERVAGRTGQARDCRLLQKQERRLLRLLEQGPERRLFRVQGQTLLRAPARKPLRQQGR
jgi:hypothetical protein